MSVSCAASDAISTSRTPKPRADEGSGRAGGVSSRARSRIDNVLVASRPKRPRPELAEFEVTQIGDKLDCGRVTGWDVGLRARLPAPKLA